MDYDTKPEISVDGSVIFRGVDFSGRMTVHQRDKNVLIIHCTSGRCWAGRFMPAQYIPARFYVYRIVKDHPTHPIVKRVVEFPARKRKRKV